MSSDSHVPREGPIEPPPFEYQYHTVNPYLRDLLHHAAPSKLMNFAIEVGDTSAGSYTLFSVAPTGRTVVVTEGVPGFQSPQEDEDGIPLVELLAVDSAGALVTMLFSHHTVMLGDIPRQQPMLTEADIREFFNLKPIDVTRLVLIKDVQVFRHYGRGNVPVQLLGAPGYPASSAPSETLPALPPSVQGHPSSQPGGMVDLTKETSNVTTKSHLDPAEVTSPIKGSVKVGISL